MKSRVLKNRALQCERNTWTSFHYHWNSRSDMFDFIYAELHILKWTMEERSLEVNWRISEQDNNMTHYIIIHSIFSFPRIPADCFMLDLNLHTVSVCQCLLYRLITCKICYWWNCYMCSYLVTSRRAEISALQFEEDYLILPISEQWYCNQALVFHWVRFPDFLAPTLVCVVLYPSNSFSSGVPTFVFFYFYPEW